MRVTGGRLVFWLPWVVVARGPRRDDESDLLADIHGLVAEPLLGGSDILVAEAGHGGHHLAHPCAHLGQSGADLGWWRLLCEGGDGSGEIGA